ncbi:MAG: phenylalanine--tRNA ligase subunit beta, partial [Nanoarchaeota archaeon]|nr:phenylalanine--tRNA ligase subunit beta [Nanoarchaeota archaeon]
MPTIKINKKSLENLIGKKLEEEKLKDRITYLGVSVEDFNKDEITLEVNPDRPDLLSVQGIARALSSFIGVKKGLRKYEVKKSGEKVIIDNSVKDVRPFTACAIVKNLKFNDEKIKEVIDIQEKLHITFGRNRKKIAIGIYPFEKIKMPITFFAEDPKKVKFQPLEFNKEITGLQILSQHPTGREYAHLLEGKNKFPFFKDADGKILSMPPIINSHDTGKISEKTKDVFIECSGFDFSVLNKCINIIVCALADMGGSIYSIELNYGNKKFITPNLEPEKMKLNIKYAN